MYCLAWLPSLLFRSNSLSLTHTHTPLFHFRTRWVYVLNATPWPLTPEKKSGIHCIGLDIGLVWTAAENLEQAGIQSADSPAYSESLFLCRQYGSLEEKREKREKSDRQHTVSPGFQICYSVQTVTHTHTHTDTFLSFLLYMGVGA